ncbi:hypothetical protein Misp06_04323 [Microbulbifer sp. NBRC 101763]|uniref:hypothetical protein n=1 Tax=Microbulbifer sp. NBRC 101763 TaxID=1113820 RepID=UPI00309FC595
MFYRVLALISLLFPALTMGEELELVCAEGNLKNNKHEVYVLYQKESASYAYLDGKKHGFGADFWEYEKISENQRNVYSAYYGSDELIFWKKYQAKEKEGWKNFTQQRFHINRITGNFELSENEQILSKGECQLGKVKKL